MYSHRESKSESSYKAVKLLTAQLPRRSVRVALFRACAAPHHCDQQLIVQLVQSEIKSPKIILVIKVVSIANLLLLIGMCLLVEVIDTTMSGTHYHRLTNDTHEPLRVFPSFSMHTAKKWNILPHLCFPNTTI